MDAQAKQEAKKKLDEKREILVGHLQHSIETDLQMLKDVAGGGDAHEFMEGLRKRIPLPF